MISTGNLNLVPKHIATSLLESSCLIICVCEYLLVKLTYAKRS